MFTLYIIRLMRPGKTAFVGDNYPSFHHRPSVLEPAATSGRLWPTKVLWMVTKLIFWLLFTVDEHVTFAYLGEEDKILTVDSELPMIPRRDLSELTHQEDDVDVDKLPRASANKKRKGKMPLEEQQQL